MMEKYLEMIKKTLDLLETCNEGLEHLILRLEQGHFNQTMSMLEDITAAIYEIQQSVEQYSDQLPPSQLDHAVDNLNYALKLVVSAYEHNDRTKALELIHSNLKPTYMEWHKMLADQIRPYVTS